MQPATTQSIRAAALAGVAFFILVTGAVLALVSLLGAFTIGYTSDAIQAVAGIAVLLDSVWILLVSVFIWRSAQRPGR